MLICPQCEFENPESNRFCQSCGVSLTHKVCCQCQASIPIKAKICNACGAANHTVLWAIISQTKTLQLDAQPELAQAVSDINHQSAVEIASLADLFAHSQSKATPAFQIQTDTEQTYNRYALKTEPDLARRLSLSNTHNFSRAFIQSQVIDQYPLQKSHLATLQKQQMDLFTELSQDLNDSYLAVTEYWNLIGLPTHALPYLILEKYTPTIPKIYDAWQQQDQGVVLLPDRSQWQLVTELWSQQQLSLAQIVWFLDEMTKLWQPLQRISCAQSLLVQENWRLDEDQAFCLQQLYMDGDQTLTLKDLAQTWQFCFAKSHLNQIEQLNLLLNKMIAGEIIEVEQLRLELHNLGLDEPEVEFLDSNEPDLANTTLFEPKMTESESEAIARREARKAKREKPREPSRREAVAIKGIPSDRAIEQEASAKAYPKGSTGASSSPDPLGKPVVLKDIASQPEIFFEETDDDMMYSSEFEEQATAMISMHLKDLTDACCTNIGVQRNHNEDFFGIKTTIEKIENNTEKNLSVRGLYIVCDGMGGHAAGEVASAMAVENLQKYFQTHWQSELPTHEIIESGVLLANKVLYQTNIENSRSGSGRMGTTLVMALLQDTQLAIAHVGDSRIYRLSRKQGLEQLTLDHEVGQREINRGVEPEIAYGRPDAYQLTQALGPRENNGIRPEIKFLEITEDCLILLCSDGMSDNDFIEENWSQHLEPLISSQANLQDGLFKLVDLANEHNGHDNITAILLRIKLKPDF
ncbi:MAG: serine/threonine phosphatase [Pleurocapsa minor HA4230-MV1]|jgi:protein phosphatase|nr:serine/threonine phosphatase [Pleurocapsa minor HA4230-MV1]